MRLHLLTFLVILLCDGTLSDSSPTTPASTSITDISSSKNPSTGGSSTIGSGGSSTIESGGSSTIGSGGSSTIGSGGSTIAATTDTPDPSAPTTTTTKAPTTTTTTQTPGTGPTITAAPVTQTVPTTAGVTAVTWTIPLKDTDPTDLLRAITILNNQVTSLKANLDDLYNGLNINGTNNYITQLKSLNNTITALDTNTTDLANQINGTTAIYFATLSNIQPLIKTVQCFRNSSCPSVCPGNLLTANSTQQQFSYTSGGSYNCTTTLQSDGTPITAELNLTLTGSAQLIVKNAAGNILDTYKDNCTNQIVPSLDLSYFTFIYSQVKPGDTISLSVNYKTEDPCENVNCSGNGACVVHDGKPICNCIGCHSGDDCSEPIDPCQGNQVKRSCTSLGGTCEPDESAGTCDWKCKCPTNKQVDDKTCSKSASDSMFMEEVKKWLYWKN